MQDKPMPKVPRSRPELEQLHAQLDAMVLHAQSLPASELAPAFGQLVAAIEADFRGEELLMECFDCADSHQHREQHARMLAGLHHAASALDQGQPLPAQQALADLRQWLPFHIETQDRHLLHALPPVPPPL